MERPLLVEEESKEKKEYLMEKKTNSFFYRSRVQKEKELFPI